MSYPDATAGKSETYIDRLVSILICLRSHRDHMKAFIDRIEGNPSQLVAKDTPQPSAPQNIPALLNEIYSVTEDITKGGDYLASRF